MRRPCLAAGLSMEVTAMRKLIIGFMAAVALAGCGSNGSTSAPPGTPTPVDAGTPTPDRAPPAWTVPLAQNPYTPKVDAAQFTDKITNRYFTLGPGTVMVYEGKRDGAPLRIELTVTTETKDIMGVRTVVVRDIVSGALDERTTDWYAQDAAGSVWYFREDTKEYTNGVVSSTAGSWEAGVDGALPGIIMQAKPVQGQAYRQEYRPTHAEDVAMIKQLGASAEVPAGKYTDVLVTNDRDLLDLNKDEDKYFTPGVGLVKLGGFVNGHREEVWLVSILAPK
jgi:hypothetical protein